MDSIARAVEPSMELPPPAAGAARAGRRPAAPCRTPRPTSPRRWTRRRSSPPTATGRTASEIARLRPRRPMIGLSHHQQAVQQMALEWGVLPLVMPSTVDVDDLGRATIETAPHVRRRRRRATCVVLIAGTAVEHVRLDERDQGRHRLTHWRARRRARRCAARRERRPAAMPRWVRPQACLALVRRSCARRRGLLYWKPLHSYLTRVTCSTGVRPRWRSSSCSSSSSSSGRDGRHGGDARPRGSPARAREARRAALHRQAASTPGADQPDRSLASARGRRRDRGAAARARRRARSGASPCAALRRPGRDRAAAVRRRRRARSRRSSGSRARTSSRSCRGSRPAAASRAGRGRREDDAGCARASQQAHAEQRRLRPELPVGIGGCEPHRQPQVPARPRGVRARPARATSSATRILAEAEPLWPRDGCCTALSSAT